MTRLLRPALALVVLLSLGPGCNQTKQRVDEINKLLAGQKFDDAAAKSDALLQDDPDAPEALRAAIAAYLGAGRTGDARTTYARLVKKKGHDKELVYALAQSTLAEATLDPDEERRAALLSLIARATGEFALDPVAALVTSGEEPTRATAARLLGEIPGPRVREVLLALRNDTTLSPLVALQVAASLLRKGEPEGEEPLSAALNSKNDLLAATAARGFAEIGDSRGAKAAERGLASSKEEAALIATEALALLDSKPATKALLKGFSDSRASVRAAVARAAGKKTTDEFIPSLRKLLQDPDPRARIAACVALANLADTASIDTLRAMLIDDINDQVRLAAAQALQRLKDELGFEFIFKTVRDASKPEMRAFAFSELAALGDTTFAKDIVAATGDTEAKVRAAAVAALGELTIKEGGPAIVSAAKDADPSVRVAAARALALVDPPGALTALSDLLGDAEVSVRVQAAVSLLARRENPPTE